MSLTFQGLQQVLGHVPADGLKVWELEEVGSLQSSLHLITPAGVGGVGGGGHEKVKFGQGSGVSVRLHASNHMHITCAFTTKRRKTVPFPIWELLFQ